LRPSSNSFHFCSSIASGSLRAVRLARKYPPPLYSDHRMVCARAPAYREIVIRSGAVIVPHGSDYARWPSPGLRSLTGLEAILDRSLFSRNLYLFGPSFSSRY
jgi:hypothetical protein